MKQAIFFFCLCHLFLVATSSAKDIPGEWVVYDDMGEEIVLQLGSGGVGKARSIRTYDAVAPSSYTGSQKKGTFRTTGGYYYTVTGQISCSLVWTIKGDTLTVRAKGRPTKKVSAEIDIDRSAWNLSDYGGYRNSIISQWKQDIPSNNDVKKYKTYMGEVLDMSYSLFETCIPGSYILRNNKLYPLHKLYGVFKNNKFSIKDFLMSFDEFQEFDKCDCTINDGERIIKALYYYSSDRKSNSKYDPWALHWVKDSIETYTDFLKTTEKFKTIAWDNISTTEDGQYYTLTEKATGEIRYLQTGMDVLFLNLSKEMNSNLVRLEKYRQDQIAQYKNLFYENLRKMTLRDLSQILETSSDYFFGEYDKDELEDNISKLFPILNYSIESCMVQEEKDCLNANILLTVGSKKQYRLAVAAHGDGRIYANSFDINRAEYVGKVKLTDQQKKELKRIKEERRK